ncbi:ATP synthase F1 subunit gamma [Patescibacteria group bacterium]|nr:ATP synthase F1 subunit gamma [Patescibacteria group bacterium]MBU1722003.1 ATP synthase F1 subunit gamma [Patescibacteria group bacterium]MBU1901247.1 ATP synthase F1 subunit gamma [Patescibacteria group bacterium]
MALSTKAIKTRIKSVKNTKKITKAMEMVSAAKMRKAVDAALNTRMYARFASELLDHLAGIDDPNYAFLEKRPVQKILMVVISSNRGLCGGFNGSIIKKASALFHDKENLARHRVVEGEETIPSMDNVEIDVLGVGKKSVAFAKRHDLNLVGVYDELSETPSFEDVLSISNTVNARYMDKTYDKVVVLYTHFQSSLVQEVKVRQLLPVCAVDIEKMLADLPGEESEPVEVFPIEQYIFEPGLEQIIEYVMPRLVEIQLYQAILESSASEHSARMVAMKSASEAADEMVGDLTLAFNKARQAAITQEIAEISSGAAALE